MERTLAWLRALLRDPPSSSDLRMGNRRGKTGVLKSDVFEGEAVRGVEADGVEDVVCDAEVNEEVIINDVYNLNNILNKRISSTCIKIFIKARFR